MTREKKEPHEVWGELEQAARHRQAERLAAMSDAELDREVEAKGMDPAALRKRGADFIAQLRRKAAMKLVAPDDEKPSADAATSPPRKSTGSRRRAARDGDPSVGCEAGGVGDPKSRSAGALVGWISRDGGRCCGCRDLDVGAKSNCAGCDAGAGARADRGAHDPAEYADRRCAAEPRRTASMGSSVLSRRALHRVSPLARRGSAHGSRGRDARGDRSGSARDRAQAGFVVRAVNAAATT